MNAITNECAGILQNEQPPMLVDLEELELSIILPTIVSFDKITHLKHSMGTTEDVFNEVGMYTLLVDFTIPDMEQKNDISLALGKPSLHSNMRQYFDVILQLHNAYLK